jgi:selenocysteine-specific elongation factor
MAFVPLQYPHSPDASSILHMLIATAGHIDHGKTLLVKRLTGIDTDRLPEEKARGISIDLGFAYSTLSDGSVMGFVDVPGHERFVRNMLAGVCGIDAAMLVVAADDGVKPQTVEHVQILNLLGVRSGVAVISKSDRVARARVTQVAAEIETLVAPTSLAGILTLSVSAVTGDGIEALQIELQRLADAVQSRWREGQHFRLAIDRAFTVTGAGTVITGTVFNGEVVTGARVMVSPHGVTARVRGIQIRGAQVDRAKAGQRCAINLAGAQLQAVARGDWLVDEPLHAPTQRLDVRLTVLPGGKMDVKHWAPIRLHIGTRSVAGRLAIAGGVPMEAGASAAIQLVLAEPIIAVNGDRFIIRDQSARRTIGGGVVLSPAPFRWGRRKQTRAMGLEALSKHDPRDALEALMKLPGQIVDLSWFGVVFNVVGKRLDEICHSLDAVVLGRDPRVAMPRSARFQMIEQIIDGLKAFHHADPKADGLEIGALRSSQFPEVPANVFHAIVRKLADELKIELRGERVRLIGHNPTANREDEALWEKLLPAMTANAYKPPTIAELSTQIGMPESIVKSLLFRKAKTSEVIRVCDDRYYPRITLAKLAAEAAALAQGASDGSFTAAQFRDAVGLGRNLVIPILECFDVLGVTQRFGNLRRMRKDPRSILVRLG